MLLHLITTFLFVESSVYGFQPPIPHRGSPFFGISNREWNQGSLVRKVHPTRMSPRSQGGGGGAGGGRAEFEMQELRVQLASIRQAGFSSSQLSPAKRNEVESYIAAVASQKNGSSPLPLREMAVGDALKGLWRLAFSTEPTVLSALPKEARVYLNIYDYDGNGRGKLDYQLRFTEKVFALESLTASSSFQIEVDPANAGLLCYQYEKITCNIFGFTLPSGLFGFLNGRVSCINSIYFDGSFWIEKGTSPDGNTYFNVFCRENET